MEHHLCSSDTFTADGDAVELRRFDKPGQLNAAGGLWLRLIHYIVAARPARLLQPAAPCRAAPGSPSFCVVFAAAGADSLQYLADSHTLQPSQRVPSSIAISPV